MRKYEASPHPFIINPPMDKKTIYKIGDEIIFHLTLIGRGLDYLPYFILAFTEFGKNGIGRDRGKFEIKDIICDIDTIIYDGKTKIVERFEPSCVGADLRVCPKGESFAPAVREELRDTVKLIFLTPARIIYNGKLAVEPDFHVIVRQLLRRMSLLAYFHCGIDPSGWDFKGIIESAKEVSVTNKHLKWYEWQRYSSRQDTKMSMGGFVGDMTISGDLTRFRSLLKAGEILHIGKGTSFGLGKFKIAEW